MQTILDSHFHLNTRIRLRIRRQSVHKNILLLDYIRKPFNDSQPQEISQPHIHTRVRFMMFVHICKIKVNCHIFRYFSWIMKQLAKRSKHMMIASVVVEFYLTNELQTNTLVFNFCTGFFKFYLNSTAYVFSVVIDGLFNFFAIF